MRRDICLVVMAAMLVGLGSTWAGDVPATQKAGEPATVAATQPGFAEPEEAVRAMYIAMFQHDRAALERATLPNKDLGILLEGEAVPADKLKSLITWAQKVPMRQSKVGDKVMIPTRKGPVEVVFTEDWVNADRQQIIVTDNPLPTTVVREENGRWRADGGGLIAGRKAAAAYRASTRKAPENGENASTQAGPAK